MLHHDRAVTYPIAVPIETNRGRGETRDIGPTRVTFATSAAFETGDALRFAISLQNDGGETLDVFCTGSVCAVSVEGALFVVEAVLDESRITIATKGRNIMSNRNPNPSEHYDPARTSRFLNTRSVEEIAGSAQVAFNARYTSGNYPKLYNVATGNANELFAYGGYVSEQGGAYIAKLDARSLAEEWRVQLTLAHHWNYPGVMAVLPDGNAYAVAGNLLAKVNSATGESRQLTLPQHKHDGGAAYNGFVVSPDGVLFTKSLERGLPCQQSDITENMGQACAAYHKIKSFLVAVDTTSDEPRIIAQTEAVEFIMSRIATERHDGVDYVYCPGLQNLWRYRFTGSELVLDEQWGPVPYATSVPGTAPAIMGDWVIIQNNGFLSSFEPFTIRAINIHDSSRSFTHMPLPAYPMSQVGSKAAIDPENMRIYTADWKAQMLVCLDFDPARGFQEKWIRKQKMFCFPSLFGDAANRQIAGTDYDSSYGDQVVWRNAATGDEVARTTYLDPNFNGSTVGPGYDGRFYYLAQTWKAIVELVPVAAPSK
jgi:hypothetical protein